MRLRVSQETDFVSAYEATMLGISHAVQVQMSELLGISISGLVDPRTGPVYENMVDEWVEWSSVALGDRCDKQRFEHAVAVGRQADFNIKSCLKKHDAWKPHRVVSFCEGGVKELYSCSEPAFNEEGSGRFKCAAAFPTSCELNFESSSFSMVPIVENNLLLVEDQGQGFGTGTALTSPLHGPK